MEPESSKGFGFRNDYSYYHKYQTQIEQKEIQLLSGSYRG